MVLGTVFSVTVSGERALVHVLEGAVAWKAPDGKRMEISAGGSLESVSGALTRGPLAPGSRDEMERGLAVLRSLMVPKPEESGETVKPAARPVAMQEQKKEGTDEAAALLEKADALKAKGKYEEAVLTYREAAMAWPQTHAGQAALFETGNLCFGSLKDMNRAGRNLREYLSAYPKGEWREEALALLIEISFKNSAYRESADLIEKALAEFPRSGKAPDLLYKLATLYRAEIRDSARAGKAYRDFLALYPDDYRAEDARYWLKETSAAR
jgi:tetratricopeptide (TPR) repeat protein